MGLQVYCMRADGKNRSASSSCARLTCVSSVAVVIDSLDSKLPWLRFMTGTDRPKG